MTQLGLSIELHTALLIASIAVVWVVCSIFAFGMIRAFFAREFKHNHGQDDDPVGTLMASMLGPISIVGAVGLGMTKHGLMFRNPKRREQTEYPKPDWRGES
jgi:hypothetical protein